MLVEVRAASVNPVDVRRRTRPTRLPKTTGSDLAGVVTAVGEGVETFGEGDRVFATGLHASRFAGGSCADYAVVPTDVGAPLPASVTFEDGAAIALVGVTAWRALVHRAALEPGSTVLVHGGNGGVGHVAVGPADAMGATVVATARPTYHEAIREIGAETVLDYRRDDLVEAIHDVAGGVDVVLDHRPEQYLATDVDVAEFDGNVVLYAGSDASLPGLSTARSKNLAIYMMSMTNLATHRDMPDIGPILERVGRLLAADRLEVRVDRTYPLEATTDAKRTVTDKSVLGKVVVLP